MPGRNKEREREREREREKEDRGREPFVRRRGRAVLSEEKEER